MKIFYKILHKKLLSLLAFLPLVGCGFGDMNYVSRQNLNSDPLYQLDRSDMTLPTNYGAIKFQEQDDSDNEYSRLKNKWEAEGTRAYEHFN